MSASGLGAPDPELMVALESQRRLSVDEYHRMIEAGILDADDHVELIEGVIVQMSPQGPRHACVIRRLCDPLFAPVPPEFLVQSQLPLTLGGQTEPEPDVAILRRSDAEARDSHPHTAALVFEVAAESLRKDRLMKAAVYAAAGISEYVIVNVGTSSLEVHRDPDPSSHRYRTLLTLEGDARFESSAVPRYAFVVAALFQ